MSTTYRIMARRPLAAGAVRRADRAGHGVRADREGKGAGGARRRSWSSRSRRCCPRSNSSRPRSPTRRRRSPQVQDRARPRLADGKPRDPDHADPARRQSGHARSPTAASSRWTRMVHRHQRRPHRRWLVGPPVLPAQRHPGRRRRRPTAAIRTPTTTRSSRASGSAPTLSPTSGDKLKAYIEVDLFGGGSNALAGNETATNTYARDRCARPM